jgi:hypothetical protein
VGRPFVYIFFLFNLLLPPRYPIKAAQFNFYGFELKNGFVIFHFFNFFTSLLNGIIHAANSAEYPVEIAKNES